VDIERLFGQYFFVLLPFIWILIVSLVARLSGWRELAEAYPPPTDFTGQRFRFQSASFRWGSNYTGIVQIGADPQGLTLSVFFLFRPGHPSLFIPWGDIRVESQGGLIPALRLRFSRKPAIPCVISRMLGERLARMSNGRFRVDP
jgi:hypothetical protein